MRMCKKRTLSLILTLALIVGCFAGTGITVKAVGDLPKLTGITVTPEALGSQGGTITLSFTGENLKTLWYQARKQKEIMDGNIVYDTKAKIETVTVENAQSFSIEIPKNYSS